MSGTFKLFEWNPGDGFRRGSAQLYIKAPLSEVERFVPKAEFMRLFGGYILWRAPRVPSPDMPSEAIGVWGSRPVSRFKRTLRERGAEYVVVKNEGPSQYPSHDGLARTSPWQHLLTQDDIDNNRITYLHDDSETTADTFAFDVDDGFGTVSSGLFSMAIASVDDDAPTVDINNFGTVVEGGTDLILSTELTSNDSEQPASSVVYTVSTPLSNGQLELTTATADAPRSRPRRSPCIVAHRASRFPS